MKINTLEPRKMIPYLTQKEWMDYLLNDLNIAADHLIARGNRSQTHLKPEVTIIHYATMVGWVHYFVEYSPPSDVYRSTVRITVAFKDGKKIVELMEPDEVHTYITALEDKFGETIF